MIVKVNGRKKTVRVKKGWTIENILKSLGLCVDEVVVLKKGTPVPETVKVGKGGLEILKIGSSG